MANRNRDNFTQFTRTKLAKQAGWICSFPNCGVLTVGSTSDGEDTIDSGEASHICAASPGGARYDETMTPEERTSIKNGIWMCRLHGKIIDSNDPEFTVERLREWKRNAEIESYRRVIRNEVVLLNTNQINEQLLKNIKVAIEVDLKVFKRTSKWPLTSVPLTLEIEDLHEPITTNALGNIVTSLDDLILVSPPGMGKTTTLFQIAEGVLASDYGMPLMVLLGDWATEGITILESILNRPSFIGISEDDIRAAAATPGVVLLLDGWNELDIESLKRARVQLAKLKAELPDLGLVISTRKQELDVPFEGKQVDLLPLNEIQQLQIAEAMRGDIGLKLLDQAWRTTGLRELITIPLYLTSLLSLPENAPFPTTKEEILRHFVAAQEMEASHAEALRFTAHGCQQNYLESLAVYATRTQNTSITDRNARSLISETEAQLASNGQITNQSQPNDVLDVLVSNHVLMRAGDMPGYSFQHQQFQEWYASHFVEHLIISCIENSTECDKLKQEIFNFPIWEEAILFAIERLARGNAYQITACGKAINFAFEVDPMLAADMIFRATEKVWAEISKAILEQVASWHVPGTVDRAFRFMLTTGRPEFFDAIWPLITDRNDQISMHALRNTKRFRPSILGEDAHSKIKVLPSKVRSTLLCEIASNSGIEGLDLVSEITKDDPDPEVQAHIVSVLAFRRADRHVCLILLNASEQTYDLVVRRSLVDEVNDEAVINRVAAARKRIAVKHTSFNDRLRAILNLKDLDDHSSEIKDIISNIDIVHPQNFEIHLINEVRNSYPQALFDGLLERVRAGRSLFHGADDILASAGMCLEDNALLQIALADPPRDEIQANAAASVLGPQSAGQMIDALLEISTKLKDVNDKYDKAATDRFYLIKNRINHLQGTILVAAIQARAGQANNNQLSLFSELLSRDLSVQPDRCRPFDTESHAVINVLIQDWGNRMLASGTAERRHLLNIATLICHSPNVNLLPLLKRLLDDNISRYRALREEAEAVGWRNCNAVDGARWPMMHEYSRSFLAIVAPETTNLMQKYLVDPYFGEFAAGVLASQWVTANEPAPVKQFGGGVNFSCIKGKRLLLAQNPNATSPEAEAIFEVIESLIKDDSTQDQRKQAITLGAVAMRLPHGQHDETIKKLLAMSDWRGRSKLLLNLILSGAEIDSKYVADGVAETLEAAKKEAWIITQSEGYQVREWIQLFPFTTRPEDSLQILQILPDNLRHPHSLEGLVTALGQTPSEGGEDVLFKLAENDPRFYQSHNWRVTVLSLGTESASRRLVDLIVNGAFSNKSSDDWYWSRELSELIAKYPDVRKYVYSILKGDVTLPALAVLARSVSENPDIEGILLLVDIENKQNQSFVDSRTLEKVTTAHVPVENWNGAYNIVPAPVNELRQKLLAQTIDGGPSDAAAQCLYLIDEIRDEHGAPLSEPRHPDFASGKSWPIRISRAS